MTILNTFAANPLDRSGNLRKDKKWIISKINHPQAKFIPMLNLKAPIEKVSNAFHIKYLNRNQVKKIINDFSDLIFLGIRDQMPYFSLNISESININHLFKSDVNFQEVRNAAMFLTNEEASILALARSMIEWSQNNIFCSKCGNKTIFDQGGYVKLCVNKNCNKETFPRTDPVVIMLVYNGDNCLLGRQQHFPKKFFSVLAGFMEPGESIENAVYREVEEETSIRVNNIMYHSSQPWPYPSSLMIGCFAKAENSKIVIDEKEIVEAKWTERKIVSEAIIKSKSSKNDPLDPNNYEINGDILLPPPMAIAHQLLNFWSNNPKSFL